MRSRGDGADKVVDGGQGISEIIDAMSEIGAPFSIAFIAPSGVLETYAGGSWPSGRPVNTDDFFYAASLAKQVTGAAIAVLAKQGILQVGRPVRDYIPSLGGWADSVTIRQLLHHISGLTPASALETNGGHWTNARVLESLHELGDDIGAGRAFAYSNIGYVVLALVVESVSGQAFPDFAARHLFGPLAIQGMGFSQTPGTPNSEQWSLLGDALPLSSGDGGLWTTAGAFVKWLDGQNRDLLEIGDLVSEAGQLSDGTPGDYGWGIGLRGDKQDPSFVHGGSWPGAGAKSVRHPKTNLALVMLGAGDMAPSVGHWTDNIQACLLSTQ